VNRMIDRAMAEVHDLLAHVERITGPAGCADMLLVRTRAEGRRILILSHVDTVHPIGTLKTSPCRRDGEKLYGPGVYDMKGGAYLALEALRRVVQAGSARLPISFLFTPDEEIGSPYSRERIQAEARHARFALVTEPARDGGKVVTSRKGVGRFTLTVKGAASHAGVRHEDGRSAIHEMAKQIIRIENKTDYARGITCNVGLIQGGTGVNVVPAECKVDVDLRVPSQRLAEEMTHWFLNLEPIGKDVELMVEGEMNRPPYQKDAGIASLFEKAQAIYQEIGKELKDVPLTGGGSDGNFTAALGIPTLDGLGADGKGAHAAYEQIYYSSLVPRTYLCTRLLETLD
jgi:glutamate carboxypeptidase